MAEPNDARLALRAQCQAVRFKAGERLFVPGDLPGSWVAIEQGRVRVSLLAPSGREVTLYRIGAGESCLLTTSSLIGDEPLPAEGFAETDVEARIASKATFDRLIAEDPDFRRDVLPTMRTASPTLSSPCRTCSSAPSRNGSRTLLARESQGIVEANASGACERTRKRARSRDAHASEVRARGPHRDRTGADRHLRPRGAAADGRACAVTKSPTAARFSSIVRPTSDGR